MVVGAARTIVDQNKHGIKTIKNDTVTNLIKAGISRKLTAAEMMMLRRMTSNSLKN